MGRHAAQQLYSFCSTLTGLSDTSRQRSDLDDILLAGGKAIAFEYRMGDTPRFEYRLDAKSL